MPDGFKSLGEIFNSEPELRNVRNVIKSSDVIIDFYNIFAHLKNIAVPQKVVKKFLFIKVENASWRSELKFREKEIVDKINSYYKEERIKGIKFSG